MRALAIATVLTLALTACGGDDQVFSPEQLQDPNTCKACHSSHFEQWAGSMHAYASVDPVFVAMNKRGQRETNNQLGTFCVQCHAPMAVALGLTDGTDYDPANLTAATNGVTCYFCHNVDKVADDHNNGLKLALDSTMRGGLENPVSASPAHSSTHDPLMDGRTNDSSMCGSCHDIVTPKGVALERTFAEWKTTFFTESDPLHHLTCGGCHMPSKDATLTDASIHSPIRPLGFHDHSMVGVDQAVTTFPGMADQAAKIQFDLDNAVSIIGPTPRTGPPAPGGICVDQLGGGEITVRMDSVSVGHEWPSGSSQDRRAWLEVIAKNDAGDVIFSTGIVPDGMDPDDIAATDPNLYALYDRALKDDGTPAQMFWEVASEGTCPPDAPCLLKAPTTLDQNDPAFDHSTTRQFLVGDIAQIATVDARMLIRPYDFGVLHSLVDSGDLDASVLANVPTIELAGTKHHWDRATAGTGAAVNTGCAPF